MAIIKTYTLFEFISDFRDYRPDQFSKEALERLFYYYDEFGEDIEFDPTAISCEWTEYDNIEEAEEEYGNIEEDYILELPSGGVLIQPH